MNQLLPIIRRVRRPLLVTDAPPTVVGNVEPPKVDAETPKSPEPEKTEPTMRLTLPARAQSNALSTWQRRAWVATWLQGRRRRRLAAALPEPEPEPSPLLVDLVGYFNLDEPGDLDDAIDFAGVMGDMAVTGGAPASTGGPGSHLARNFSGGGSLTQLVDFDGFSGPPFSINFWIFQNSNGGQYPFDCSAGPAGFTCFLATDGMYVNMYAFTPDYDSPGTIQTSGNYGAWIMFTLI